MKIGTKLRQIRMIKGLKQEAMSDLLGISQPAYSKIESNETDVTLSRLSQIAEKLNCTEEDIMAFDERYVFQNCVNAGNFNTQHYQSGIEKNVIEELLKGKDEVIKTKDLYIAVLEKQISLLKSPAV